MSEFYRPASEEGKDELREGSQLEKTSLEGSVDSKAQISTPEKIEEDKSEIETILDQYVPLELHGDNLNPDNIPHISEIVYSQIINHESLSSEDDAPNTISYTLDRINKALPKINDNILILDGYGKSISTNPKVVAYRNRLLDYQGELLLLKEQLEYKLENHLFLTDTLIQNALDQYRLYKVKLEKLPPDSGERPDIESILGIYESHIKEQFKQSPEKYGLGKSKAFDLNMEILIDHFMEAVLTGDESYHQRSITETRSNILTELRQTPGIVGVIPIPEGTSGSKSADIIAITLKSPDIISPDEIDNGLNLLYSQIQSSASSINTDNIDLYNQNGMLTSSETQTNTNLDLSRVFQLHLIKITKSSTDFKYDKAYQPHTQAMARFSDNWDATNNISALTDSYYESLDGRPTKRKFNRALFQLSVQDILGLPLS